MAFLEANLDYLLNQTVAMAQALPSLRAVGWTSRKPTCKLFGLETGTEANGDLPPIASRGGEAAGRGRRDEANEVLILAK